MTDPRLPAASTVWLVDALGVRLLGTPAWMVRKRPPRSITCPVCKRTFQGRGGRLYCSDPCSKVEHNRRRLERIAAARSPVEEVAR